MGKIVFMSTSDDSMNSMQQFVAQLKDPGSVRILRAALDNAVYIARGLDPREVDAVVVRGNTASALSRARLPFPVIPLTVGTEEIAQAFDAARRLVGKEKPVIGVSGFEQSISDIKALLSLSGIEIRFYHIESIEDIYICAEKALQDGIDIMISGRLCTAECLRRGLPAVEMGTTLDSIRLAYEQAREFQKSALRQRVLSEQESLLSHNAPEALIAVTPSGEIVSANRRAGIFFNRPPENLRGSALSDLSGLESLEMEAAARMARDGSTAVISHGREKYALTAESVSLPRGKNGYVLRFQAVSDIRRMELAVRRALSPEAPPCPKLNELPALGLFTGDTLAAAQKAARSYAPLLLISEPGCGAELLSRSIHLTGPRSNMPFTPCDCRALSGDIGEVFDRSRSGTLFLGCISSLDAASQLEAASYLSRAGSDVRVIASLQDDPYSEMRAGKLCPELGHALTADVICLPPLREHPEDLEAIFNAMLSACSPGRRFTLPEGCGRELRASRWYGNLIQLFALARSAAASGDEITPQLLRQKLARMASLECSGTGKDNAGGTADEPQVTVKNSVLSKSRLESVLRRNGGSRSLTASELGLSRTSLYKCMRELGIE